MPHSRPRHNPRARKKTGRTKAEPGDPFYSGAPWRRLRKWFLGHHKLCADPFRIHAVLGIGTPPAREVHHKIDRAIRPDLQYDSSNLQALCKRCHSRLTWYRQRRHP